MSHAPTADTVPGNARTAAQVLVDSLVAHGVDRVYCVAGESYLTVLDALYDSPIDVVTCRHEASAGFAALADGKLTGRPGVVLVNRGPGASNATIALHAARQDAAPLLLIVGHVRSGEIGRDSFQEVDYHLTYADLAKGVWTLHRAGHTAETVTRALRSTVQATPGPAVLVLPEDVLAEPAAVAGQAQPGALSLTPCPPDSATVARISELLTAARRPLLIGGGLLASAAGRRALGRAAERHVLPVAVSNKHQDLFDNTHPLYAGHLNIATQPAQRALLGEADLVLAVGTRLDAVTTQNHTLPAAPVPAQTLIQVYPDPGRLGRVCQPTEALACDPVAFLTALGDTVPGLGIELADRWDWAARVHRTEARSAAWRPHESIDGLPFGSVVAALNALTEPDAVITVDAGNFTSWVHRYYRFAPVGTLLGLGCGAMGFGVPSGLAAALRHPDRQVVTVVGDGGFLMTGTELATAVQRRARLVVVIADNGSYGTIRQHQERAYPARVVATDLLNPDFAALARAFGARGIRIEDERDLNVGLREALDYDGPTVVSVRTSLAWISAYQHLALPTGIDMDLGALDALVQG